MFSYALLILEYIKFNRLLYWEVINIGAIVCAMSLQNVKRSLSKQYGRMFSSLRFNFWLLTGMVSKQKRRIAESLHG